jgi:hypothetical protein
MWQGPEGPGFNQAESIAKNEFVFSLLPQAVVKRGARND